MNDGGSPVTFSEEEAGSVSIPTNHKRFDIAIFVVSHSGGLIKNEKQAGVFLIIFVGLCFIIAFMLLSGGGADEDASFTPPADAPQGEVIPPAFF